MWHFFQFQIFLLTTLLGTFFYSQTVNFLPQKIIYKDKEKVRNIIAIVETTLFKSAIA
jgi:hypothetical protein